MVKKVEKAEKESTGKAVQTQPAAYPGPFEEMERWLGLAFPQGWLPPVFRHGWPAWPELEPMFGGRTPKVDVIDRPGEVVVRAELPGVDKDKLDVSLSERSLTIRASVQQEKQQDDEHYHRRELSRGEFLRTVPLPSEVNGDKGRASFKDGVLELTLPKVAGAQRKSIKVE
jgi:HSP20 family protein